MRVQKVHKIKISTFILISVFIISCNQMKKSASEPKVIEYVTFLAKDSVSDDNLLKSAKQTDSVLEEIPGFINHYLAKQDNGTWVEVVFWESKAFATDGLEVFLKHPLSEIFLNNIKEGSVKIEYSNVK